MLCASSQRRVQRLRRSSTTDPGTTADDPAHLRQLRARSPQPGCAGPLMGWRAKRKSTISYKTATKLRRSSSLANRQSQPHQLG